MLEEYKEVRQREGEGFRRFFSNSEYDLIVWYDLSINEISGFQICYDKRLKETVFTYKYEEGRLIKSHRINEEWGSTITSFLNDKAGSFDSKIALQVINELDEKETKVIQFIKDALNL